VKALEASGIIAGYRAEAGRLRAGLGLSVFLGLKSRATHRRPHPGSSRPCSRSPRSPPATRSPAPTTFLVEAAVPDLASYEQLLLGQILTIPSVVDAQSTFAIRTILSHGPLPLNHWRH